MQITDTLTTKFDILDSKIKVDSFLRNLMYLIKDNGLLEKVYLRPDEKILINDIEMYLEKVK